MNDESLIALARERAKYNRDGGAFLDGVQWTLEQATAREQFLIARLRGYIGKASFATGADRYTVTNLLDELAAALAREQEAQTRDVLDHEYRKGFIDGQLSMREQEAQPFPQKEFDALLDHIYEHGTTAEGVKALAQRMIGAAQPAAQEKPHG